MTSVAAGDLGVLGLGLGGGVQGLGVVSIRILFLSGPKAQLQPKPQSSTLASDPSLLLFAGRNAERSHLTVEMTSL